MYNGAFQYTTDIQYENTKASVNDIHTRTLISNLVAELDIQYANTKAHVNDSHINALISDVTNSDIQH